MNSQAGPTHDEAIRKQAGGSLGGSLLSRDRTKLSDPPGVHPWLTFARFPIAIHDP